LQLRGPMRRAAAPPEGRQTRRRLQRQCRR
jgi:hypothetical protein